MLLDRFKATFNLASIGLGHVSLEGKWLLVNPKLCEITGYSESEILRMRFQDITYPEDLGADLELFHKLVKGEIRSYGMDKRYVRKDGSLVWIHLNASLFLDAPGRTPVCIAVIEDIQERKAKELSLKAARRKLEDRVVERTATVGILKRELDSFFDLNLDIMAILEEDGTFRRVNPALCGLLGFGTDDLCGADSAIFVYPADRARVQEMREAAKFDLQPRIYECRHPTRNGGLRWISWSEIAIGGEHPCIYTTGRDITAQKLQQSRLARMRRALQTRSQLRVLGSMAANMAHEINNPLTVILGDSYLLQKMARAKAVPHDKLTRIADTMIQMGERIVGIVRGLQTASNDGSKDPFESVTVASVLEDTLPYCRGAVNVEGIDLKVETYDHPIEVFCQPAQLVQILISVINNAFDAAALAPAPREVHIAIHALPTRVEFRVSDSGDGLSEEIRAKLFEPFVTTKANGQGLGLSLNLAKNTARLQNGELYFDSSAEKTTFVVSMPRAIKKRACADL